MSSRLFGPGLILVPTYWSFIQIDVHLLGLQVRLDAIEAELAAVSALFVTAPREFIVGGMISIDPGYASSDFFDHADGLVQIECPDGRGQSIFAVVGDANRFIFGPEGDHG